MPHGELALGRHLPQAGAEAVLLLPLRRRRRWMSSVWLRCPSVPIPCGAGSKPVLRDDYSELEGGYAGNRPAKPVQFAPWQNLSRDTICHHERDPQASISPRPSPAPG